MYNILDKNSTIIDSTVSIGDNCIIYPNVVIKGNSIIGDNTVIYPSSVIENSVIGSNNKIFTSYVMNSKIDDNNEIGPYACIRSTEVQGEKNRLGCFVELKEVKMGNGNKIPHLSYIGNTEIENNVHVGCGSITVNKKVNSKVGEREKTYICDNAFIGCNVNLLAPIKLEKNSVVAAGSTIKSNVPENALSIERSKEVIIENYN